MLRFLLVFSALLVLFPMPARAQQDAEPIRDAIAAWLHTQTAGLPGEVSYEIGTIGNTRLASCERFDISRPLGAPAWGRGHVAVRCMGSAGWRINVPVHIRVKADYYVAARSIPQGQSIMAEDLALQSGDLSAMPARIVTDENQALGKTANVSIPAGAPLRTDMLRAVPVIRQGQTVRVISRGNGFEVANEGRAMSNAAEGQLAQIRMPNGQIVSGVARAGGIIEISF